MSSLGRGGAHPGVVAVAALHAALDDLLGASWWALGTAELAGLAVGVEEAARRPTRRAARPPHGRRRAGRRQREPGGGGGDLPGRRRAAGRGTGGAGRPGGAAGRRGARAGGQPAAPEPARHDGRLGLRGILDNETAAVASAVRRYADAFTDALHLAATHPRMPAARGERPTILVDIGLAALQADLTAAGITGGAGAGPDGVGPGWLDTGAPLPAAATRRLACDARIIPTVLGSASELLDIGRANYTVPKPRQHNRYRTRELRL